MNKKTYIAPTCQVIALEPLQMLADSIRVTEKEEEGVTNPDQILTKEFEWEDRGNYWED